MTLTKKQGIVTSYRTIRKHRRSSGLEELGRYSMVGGYEETRVPQRRVVTWGVDIERLADWLAKQGDASREDQAASSIL